MITRITAFGPPGMVPAFSQIDNRYEGVEQIWMPGEGLHEMYATLFIGALTKILPV